MKSRFRQAIEDRKRRRRVEDSTRDDTLLFKGTGPKKGLVEVSPDSLKLCIMVSTDNLEFKVTQSEIGEITVYSDSNPRQLHSELMWFASVHDFKIHKLTIKRYGEIPEGLSSKTVERL